jgi:hypothetical protein
MRLVLALYVTLFPLLLILSFGFAADRGLIDKDNSHEVVEMLLPVFSGYLGLIVGYYFGKKEPNE